MNSKPTLQTILSHRSIRKFTQQPISEEIFQMLIDAGKAASTSNHLQCVSIIRVTDKVIREALREVSGMQYVVDCPEFLVFCIDFNKHKQLVPKSQLDWAEVSLIGAVDTGIFAQNVLLAAESLGLGGVYIGALRNNIEKVSQLLNLPDYCVPLVGMCLGYPAQAPDLKPRLPNSLVCYTNQYKALDEQQVAKYNENLTAYYQTRSGQPQQWQSTIDKTLNGAVRPHILPFFNRKGLLKK